MSTKSLTLEELQATHVPAIICVPYNSINGVENKDYEEMAEEYDKNYKKHNEWLKSKIGKKVYFHLKTHHNVSYSVLGKKRTRVIRDSVVLVVRLGNYVENDKMFIDFHADAYDEFNELGRYPCRCNDQHGKPIEETYRRIYLGKGLVNSIGTFYIPKLDLE